MNAAFFTIGLSFVVVGITSSIATSDVVWSTFATLGVVFLALAFVLDPDEEEAVDDGTGPADEDGGEHVDEDV